MAFQSTIPVETIFGFSLSEAYAKITKVNGNLGVSIEITLTYYTNKQAAINSKASIDAEVYYVQGDDYQDFQARLLETGNIYTASYDFLRTVKNTDGELLFPTDKWIDVED